MSEIKKTIGMFRDDETGRFSMEIDPETKDLKCDDSFDTDIFCSLFSDRRANEAEKTKSEQRRGWEGDVVAVLNGYFIGSKWWLNEQSRWNQKTVNKYVSDAEKALEHFTENKLVTSITVSGKLVSVGIIEISVIFYIDNNPVHTFTTRIWKESKFA